ncbi:MAG: hypothetical protein KC708_22255 [Anaerolineae bacterium]|nr:hypothetical protein [Anaerolineae bacterium]
MAVRVGWGDSEGRFIYIQFIAYCTPDDLTQMQQSLAALVQGQPKPPLVVNLVDHRGSVPAILPYLTPVSEFSYDRDPFIVLIGMNAYDRLLLRHQIEGNLRLQRQLGICDSLSEARMLIAPDAYRTGV